MNYVSEPDVLVGDSERYDVRRAYVQTLHELCWQVYSSTVLQLTDGCMQRCDIIV